jgi:hypothetical protein
MNYLGMVVLIMTFLLLVKLWLLVLMLVAMMLTPSTLLSRLLWSLLYPLWPQLLMSSTRASQIMRLPCWQGSSACCTSSARRGGDHLGAALSAMIPPDEYINTSAIIIPSVEILGPITRSRAQQLNHQVNSFLCSFAYNIESRLLPNDLIVLRNQGEDHGGQTKHQEGVGDPRRCVREGDEPIQFGIAEFESNSESNTTSYSNWCLDCIRPLFWTFYICTES